MKSRKGVTGLEKKTYVTTPRLVMGCGTFAQAGEEMARLGASRVFVLTGGHAVREGKAGALEKALRAVENIQVLNVHLQENEGGLFLQVPLMFEGFTGKADILIRREGKGHGTDSRDGVFRALFALDMDALGDVMAQARFSGKAVACRIDCASGAAASFVAGLLPDLERRLAAAGYRVEHLGVRADSRVRERMQDSIREELHGDGQALSVFA